MKKTKNKEVKMMKSIDNKLDTIKHMIDTLNQQESLEKAKKMNSVFSMDDAHAVLGMVHRDGKAHLHAAVDASSATSENKAKIKAAIENTKNAKGLSSLVSNHVLAAGGEGHKPGELKVL